MRNFCRRFPFRFELKSPGTLCLLAALLLGAGGSSRAQTPPLGGELRFALTNETVTAGQSQKTISVLRTLPARGKVEVDVKVGQTTLPVTFADFQLRADTTLEITEAGTNILVLDNPRSPENPVFSPTISASHKTNTLVVKTNVALTFNFSATELTVKEGETARVSVVLTATPAAGEATDVAVDYVIRAPGATERMVGTAAAGGGDATLGSGTLTFEGSQTSQTIDIPINVDDTIEFDETVVVELTAARGEANDPADPMAKVRYQLPEDALKYAKVKILFNGDPSQPQPAGAVDQNFNKETTALISPGALGPVTAVAVDSANRYYVAGNFQAVNTSLVPGFARLNAAGTVDATFRPNGAPDGSIDAMLVYSSGPHAGKVLIGGGFTSIAGVPRGGIARFMPDGQIDPTFDPGNGANGPIYAVATAIDGTVVVGGDFTMFNGVPRGRIAMLRPDGTLDANAFNGAGFNGPVNALALKPGARQTFQVNVSETDRDTEFVDVIDVPGQIGTLTLTLLPGMEGFGERFTVRFAGQTIFDDVILTNDIVVVPDPANGTTTTNLIPIVLQIPFQIQSAGEPLELRVSPLAPPDQLGTFGYSVAVDVEPSNFDVVAGGDFTQFDGQPQGRIALFNAAGQLNAQFAQRMGLGANGPVNALAFQGDNIIVGGEFQDLNGTPTGGVGRLLADGTADESFLTGSGTDDAVLTVAVDGQDRIYIGGQFMSYNGTRRVFLARLLPGGALDTTFLDTAFNHFAGFPDSLGFTPFGVISSVAVAPGGEVFAGGIFDAVGGGGDSRAALKPRQNFARLVNTTMTPAQAPGNIQFAQTLYGAPESGGTMTVNVARQSGTLGIATVSVVTEDGSAIKPDDYTAAAADATFGAGTSAQTFIVDIIDDELIEGSEDFFLLVSGPVGFLTLREEHIPVGVALGTPVLTVGRILDNDQLPSIFQFSAAEFDVDETRPSATITVQRTGSVLGRVTVEAVATVAPTAPNPASDPADFRSVTNVLTFPPNITTATFQVPIFDDQDVEQEEIVSLYLTNNFTGTIIEEARKTASLNIIDNDLPSGRVDFSQATYDVTENGTNAVLQVRRRGGSVGTITLNYRTEDVTALAGADYAGTSGRLTWNNADISVKTITIPLTNDDRHEETETFRVILENASPAGVIGIRNPATVTVMDDDAYGEFVFGSAQFYTDENGTSAVIPVLRRNGSAEEVTVDFRTVAGTAVAGTDYQNANGTLTFPAGVTAQSFTAPILDDTAADGHKTVTLELLNPTLGTLGSPGNATLTIIDNETLNIPAGDVETDFALGPGANGPVNAVVVQNDTTDENRRIVIAGDFSQYDVQNRPRIARLLDDGRLDRRFAQNLLVNGSIQTMIKTTSGMLIIGGDFVGINETPLNRIARLNALGQVDPLFNPGAGANGMVHAVAESVTGAGAAMVSKLVVAGNFTAFNGVARERIVVLRNDGSLDPTFHPGRGANGRILAVAVQRDGKILVGGEFTSFDGLPQLRIARLHANGALDPSFNPLLAANATVRAIAIQQDDRILVGGDFTDISGSLAQGVVRLDLNGNLDATFATGIGANAPVRDVEVQADGRILVAGDFTNFNNLTRNRIVRLLPNGEIDLSINFGTGANNSIRAMALQLDRKIVAVGNFTEFDSAPRGRVARIYGGSIAGSGTVEFERGVYTVSETESEVTISARREGGMEGTLRVMYDVRNDTATPFDDFTPRSGEIVFEPGVTAQTFTIPILNDNLTEDPEYFIVELLNPQGGALGRQPFVTVEIISEDNLLGFVDSEVRVDEAAGLARVLVRRNWIATSPVTVMYDVLPGTALPDEDYTPTSGTLTFNAGDIEKEFSIPILNDAVVEETETAEIVLQAVSANALIGAGSSTLRIDDNDFAPGRFGFTISELTVVENQPSIELTVARSSGRAGAVSVNYSTVDGTAAAPGDFELTAGTLTFAEGEISKTIVIPLVDDIATEGTEMFRVVLSDPTGGAVIGTFPGVDVTLVDSDFGAGSLDADFAADAGANAPIRAIIRQSDGSFLIAGEFTTFDNVNRKHIARVTIDGDNDPSFDPGIGPDDFVSDLAIADGFGNVAIGGEFRAVNSLDYLYVARLRSSGALDLSMSRSAGLNGDVHSLVVQPDGRVVVGGAFTAPTLRVARITRDGSLDPSFNIGAQGIDGIVRSVELGENGRIVVSGDFELVSGVPRGGVAVLMANGLVAPDFTPPNLEGTVYEALPLADGKILVAGDFGVPDSSLRNLIRLNSDGSVDAAFAAIEWSGGPVRALALMPDGKLMVAGEFLTVNGMPQVRIARFDANGALDESFDPGQGADAAVNDMVAQPDGAVVIVGVFTKVNGFPREGIARLNPDLPPQVDPINITVTREASDLVLTFTSQTGVDYELLGSIDLLTWAPIRPVASQGANTTVRVAIPDTAGYQFFVIRRTSP